MRTFEVQRPPYGKKGDILHEANIENPQMIDLLIERGALKDVTPEGEPNSPSPVELAETPEPSSGDSVPSEQSPSEPSPVEQSTLSTDDSATSSSVESEPSTEAQPAEPTAPEQTPSAYAIADHES